MNIQLESLQKNIEDLTKDLEFLRESISVIQDSVYFNATIFWTAVAFVVTASGTALYFITKALVNNRIEKELDKRLISFLQDNPPAFSASGSNYPGPDGIIYLSPEIKGIEHLEPEKVLFVITTPETLLQNSKTIFNPIVRKNEKGVVEIEIPDYHENNGRVDWKLVWLRKHYTI